MKSRNTFSAVAAVAACALLWAACSRGLAQDRANTATDDIEVLRQKEAMRRTLGYLPQEFGVYPNVSAQRLLEHLPCSREWSTGARALK